MAAGLDAAGDDSTVAIEHAALLLEHSRAARELGRGGTGELLRAEALLRTKLPESHPSILRVLNRFGAQRTPRFMRDMSMCIGL